jgi:hypothetical protein
MSYVFVCSNILEVMAKVLPAGNKRELTTFSLTTTNIYENFGLRIK